MSSYINIKRKDGSASPVEIQDFYIGADIKSIATAQTGATTAVATTVTIKTVSGVTAALTLTTGIVDSAVPSIQKYFWDAAIAAASKGSDFAGISGQMGNNAAGIGEMLQFQSGGGPESVVVTIDSVTIT